MPRTDDEKTALREHPINYAKRYDQVSWRSADTNFEPQSSADERGSEAKPMHTILRKNTCCGKLCSKRNRKLTALIIVVIVFVCIMGGLIYLYYNKPSESYRPSASVQTSCGPVTGVIEGVFNEDGVAVDSFVFKGIPYAVPPVDEHRWRKTVSLSEDPSKCWKDTLKANKFGSMCFQGSKKYQTGSENCLYLNVWSPELNAKSLRPVFVWIHGGSLYTGSGNFKGYSPSSNFVQSMDVVAVSMNYRLNAFGFLTLEELWRDNESYANYGFFDQIAALKWIQENIEKFGGDPKSVTLVGQSSGGTSIFGLLSAPLAEGLFHKAISMSGSPNFPKTYKQAAQENRPFIANSKCSNISNENLRQCLYNLTAREVIEAIPYEEGKYGSWYLDPTLDFPDKDKYVSSYCVIDPIVTTNNPYLVKNVKFQTKHKVSLLVGSTAQEIAFRPYKTFNGPNQWTQYKSHLKNKLDKFSKKYYNKVFNELYKNYTDNATNTNNTAEFMHETVTSDVRENCPNTYLAREVGKGHKYTTFRYVVTNHPSKEVSYIGMHPSKSAFHGWDAAALFNYTEMDANFTRTANNDKFAKTLRDNIKHFMRYGHLLDPEWGAGKTAVFDENADVVVLNDGYHQEQCDFFNREFLSYAWVN